MNPPLRCFAIATAGLLFAAVCSSCRSQTSNVSARVTGNDGCTASVTLLTTPPSGGGEPTFDRQSFALLPFEATRALPAGTSLNVMANAFHCRNLTCTLLVDGREVAHQRGVPIADDGLSANCEWRSP